MKLEKLSEDLKDGLQNPATKAVNHSYIKSKTKLRAPVGPRKLGGETVSDNKRVAAALNEYFGSVYTRE